MSSCWVDSAVGSGEPWRVCGKEQPKPGPTPYGGGSSIRACSLPWSEHRAPWVVPLDTPFLV